MKLRFNLGVAQMMLEPLHLDDAEQTFQSLIDDAATALPADHWMLMAFHARHGMCRLQAARSLADDVAERAALLAEARDELLLAVDGLEAKLGGKNRQTTEAVAALREVYELSGDAKATAELERRFAVGK